MVTWLRFVLLVWVFCDVLGMLFAVVNMGLVL